MPDQIENPDQFKECYERMVVLAKYCGVYQEFEDGNVSLGVEWGKYTNFHVNPLTGSAEVLLRHGAFEYISAERMRALTPRLLAELQQLALTYAKDKILREREERLTKLAEARLERDLREAQGNFDLIHSQRREDLY